MNGNVTDPEEKTEGATSLPLSKMWISQLTNQEQSTSMTSFRHDLVKRAWKCINCLNAGPWTKRIDSKPPLEHQ
jgi:hypothetical protein